MTSACQTGGKTMLKISMKTRFAYKAKSGIEGIIYLMEANDLFTIYQPLPYSYQ